MDALRVEHVVARADQQIRPIDRIARDLQDSQRVQVQQLERLNHTVEGLKSDEQATRDQFRKLLETGQETQNRQTDALNALGVAVNQIAVRREKLLQAPLLTSLTPSDRKNQARALILQMIQPEDPQAQEDAVGQLAQLCHLPDSVRTVNRFEEDKNIDELDPLVDELEATTTGQVQLKEISTEIKQRIESKEKTAEQKLFLIDMLIIVDRGAAIESIINTFCQERKNPALRVELINKLNEAERDVASNRPDPVIYEQSNETLRKLEVYSDDAGIRNLVDSREKYCSSRKNQRRCCSSTNISIMTAIIIGVTSTLSSMVFTALATKISNAFTANHT